MGCLISLPNSLRTRIAQATLYKAAQRFLEANARVASVTYRLPNRHYVPVDLTYAGLENMQPPEVAEVFCPVDAPR